MEEIFIYAKRITGYMRFKNFVSRFLYGAVVWSFGWVDAPSRGVSNTEMAWELVRGPLTAGLPVGGPILGAGGRMVGAAVTSQTGKLVITGALQIGSNGVVTNAELVGMGGTEVSAGIATSISAAEAFETTRRGSNMDPNFCYCDRKSGWASQLFAI